MDFLSNMNNAINYIEDNLDGDINYEKLSIITLSPMSNFQRFFIYTTGLSLSEYIRKRRLTNAALDLQKCSERIIDIAVKYGYESQSSFTKAFQNQHGITPKQAQDGFPVKSYSKLHFHFSIKGDSPLNYKIIEKPEFNMLGIKKNIKKNNSDDGSSMIDLWNSLKSEREKIADMSEEKEKYVYGVTHYKTEKSFDYYIAVISSATNGRGNGYEVIRFPSVKWAIFQCTGTLPDAQINTWRKIFTEWLPFSGFSLIDVPEIEWYSSGDIYSNDYESEIWIPVK